MYYVYILKWQTKFYCWFTSNLERRIKEHTCWKGGQTTSRMWDIIFLWYFEFSSKAEALKFETKIKKSWHIERYSQNVHFNKMG